MWNSIWTLLKICLGVGCLYELQWVALLEKGFNQSGAIFTEVAITVPVSPFLPQPVSVCSGYQGYTGCCCVQIHS